jgi:WD40 repeat protein
MASDLNHVTMLLRDAFLLLDRYGFALKNHPEHIYHTGHLFMSSSVLFVACQNHPLGRLIIDGRSQPTGYTRRVEAHADKVWCVAASPEGNIIATGSTDSSIHLWTARGDSIATLTGHTDKVQCLAFSHNGSTLASGSADETIRLYDMHTLECTSVLRGHTKRVISVAFTLDGHVVSGSWDKSVRIWRADVKEPIESFSVEREVFSVAISPDDSLIAIGGARMLVLYDRHTQESRSRTLGDVVSSVFSVAFSPAGDRLAAGMQDGSVCSWDLSQPESRGIAGQRPSFDDSVAITSVAWSSDGRKVFSASREKLVQAHDALEFGRRTGKVITRGFTSPLRDLLLLPNRSLPRLVAVDEDGGMTIWDEEVNDVSSASSEALDVAAIAFSPDGAVLATASSMGTVIIRNSADGNTMGTLRGPRAVVSGLFFSEDSAKLSLLCEDGSESTWKAGIDFTVPSRLSSPDTLARDEMIFTSDDDGWLYVRHFGLPGRLRLCWIPPDRRWSSRLTQITWSGTKVAFGNDEGVLTIIDFADVKLGRT